MTEAPIFPALAAGDIASMVAVAGRAPSIHNTQPWRFRATETGVELYADKARRLAQIDPTGREMLISCGAALFGLRLGLRKLGYVPDVELLPDASHPDLIAHVRPAGVARISREESELLAALPHRHTHRGGFVPGEVSARLLAGLRLDAVAEQAELVVVSRPGQVRELAGLVLAAAHLQAASPEIAAELRDWVRPAGVFARDGIPAQARVGDQMADPTSSQDDAGPVVCAAPVTPWLPQRDFGLPGTEARGGHPPAVTAVLATAGDSRADWVRAGQALHRMLLHAATRWVFASLQSQPLESPALRAEVRACLGLDGQPQLLLQLGRANIAAATARRPATETVT